MRPFEDILAQLQDATTKKGYTHDIPALWHETATQPHFYEKPAEHIAGSIEHAVNQHTAAGYTHPLTGEDVVHIVQNKSLPMVHEDAHVAKCNEDFQAMVSARRSPIVPKPVEATPRSDIVKKGDAQRGEDAILKGLRNQARDVSKGFTARWQQAGLNEKAAAGMMGFFAVLGFANACKTASEIQKTDEDGNRQTRWSNVAATALYTSLGAVCTALALGALPPGRGRA